MKSKFLKELASFTEIPKEGTTYSTHGIHPYAAKFIPQIPSRIIEECSNERHVVLDPFCGSGTTLLEAFLKGRDSIGFDSNPIAYLISKVKTSILTDDDWDLTKKILKKIKIKFEKRDYSELWIPKIPRINHWFTKTTTSDLGLIAFELKKIENKKVKNFLEVVFSSIVVLVSNQESETRYASISKNLPENVVQKQFFRKAKLIEEKIKSLSLSPKTVNTKCSVFLGDIKKLSEYIPPRSVDLVITSPPYLNSYDYYLYHKFRVYWLGFDEDLKNIHFVRKKEIGSRAEYSGKNGKPVSKFEKDMKDALIEVGKVTKLGKLIFILVGDSIVKNEFLQMDIFYQKIAKKIGLELVAKTSYPIHKISRSFTSQRVQASGSFEKMQHILIFKNRYKPKEASFSRDSFTQEPDKKSDLIVDKIPNKVINGSTFFIKNNKVTNYTHGIVKYPSKYIPDIPRWAINNYSKFGDTILDPFVGAGTTLVEARLLGRNAIGIDINPYAVLASNVKSNPLTIEDLNNSFKKIIDRVNKVDFKLPVFPLRDFWFNKKALEKIMMLRAAILCESNQCLKDFFLLVLSSIIKPCSYWDESQIKIERDQTKIFRGVPDPIFLFRKKAIIAINGMVQFNQKAVHRVNTFAILSDSKNIPPTVRHNKNKFDMKNFDLVVTSPPYINAINYPMFNRFELFLLDLIDPKEYLKHQQKYLGTERVYANEYNRVLDLLDDDKKFYELNNKIRIINKLEPKRAYIVKRYFDGMYTAIQEIHRVLNQNGKLICVVGSNTVKNVKIPTYDILEKFAEEIGFSLINSFSYRIRRHRFKITRHETGKKIKIDNIMVMERL